MSSASMTSMASTDEGLRAPPVLRRPPAAPPRRPSYSSFESMNSRDAMDSMDRPSGPRGPAVSELVQEARRLRESRDVGPPACLTLNCSFACITAAPKEAQLHLV